MTRGMKTFIVVASVLTIVLGGIVPFSMTIRWYRKNRDQTAIAEARHLCVEAGAATNDRQYTKTADLLNDATWHLVDVRDQTKNDVLADIESRRAIAKQQQTQDQKSEEDRRQRETQARTARKEAEQAAQRDKERKVQEQVAAEQQSRTESKAARAVWLESKISQLVRTGAIHNVDVQNNQARIPPIIWLGLSLEEKQGVVKLLSAYFDAKDSTGRVTILGSLNDQKLATYSIWSGIEIHR